MAVDLARFIKLRPFLFHVTARENLVSLQLTHRLEPAAELIRRAGRSELLAARRRSGVAIVVDGVRIELKDQAPLIFANAELAGGWTPDDFVAHLNEHVYFWPGCEDGPIKHGSRLLEHYAADAPLVIRIPTPALLAANISAVPLFCEFNSGAPRMQRGKKVPRGPHTFATAEAFPRGAAEVVELVFRSSVQLPQATDVWLDGHWAPLSRAAT